MIEAWRLLLQCTPQLQHLQTFVYDLVDVGRQVLSKHATPMWQRVVAAYRAGDSAGLVSNGRELLGLLDDMEELLSSNR